MNECACCGSKGTLALGSVPCLSTIVHPSLSPTGQHPQPGFMPLFISFEAWWMGVWKHLYTTQRTVSKSIKAKKKTFVAFVSSNCPTYIPYHTLIADGVGFSPQHPKRPLRFGPASSMLETCSVGGRQLHARHTSGRVLWALLSFKSQHPFFCSLYFSLSFLCLFLQWGKNWRCGLFVLVWCRFSHVLGRPSYLHDSGLDSEGLSWYHIHVCPP